jgi:hypothetical protein
MPNVVASALRMLRTKGPAHMLRYARTRVSEEWHERRLGIDTRREVPLERYGIHDPLLREYSPISYPSLRAALRRVSIRAGEDVLVDYGAGKGRVVVFAATLPFRRIIGVELIPELADMARENLRRAARHLKCNDVTLHVGDARAFVLPTDATIIHFFNPFRGSALDAVMARLRGSLTERPRRVTVLFANPDDFERLLRDGRVFPQGWVSRREDVRWPDAERVDPDANRYRVYDVDPSRGSSARAAADARAAAMIDQRSNG